MKQLLNTSVASPVEPGKGRLFSYFSTKALLLTLATFALTGCSVSEILESKVDEPQVYVLRASDVSTAQIAYPVQISVALPTAAPGLDTSRISVLRNHSQLDYFFGARWGGTAPQVVQSFVIETLQAQQGFKSIAADTERMDADYLLTFRLQDFQAEYAGEGSNPIVHVTLSGTLVNIKTRKLSAPITATARVPADDNRLAAVVAAFRTAMQQTTATVSTQLTAAVAK